MNNYPVYREWQEAFAGKDVVIIGIHTPESKGEADIAAVERKSKEAGFKFVTAIDNDSATWRAWGNRYWPSVYLIDRKGKGRARWDGELRYQGATGDVQMKARIESLLREKA